MGTTNANFAKPGHEYTKQNVKFLTTVLRTEPVMKLQSFAENNQQTQGKFTIGDEKVSLATPRNLKHEADQPSNTMFSCDSMLVNRINPELEVY